MSGSPRRIAVLDIGKTNAKIALADLATRSEIAVSTRPNRVLDGPPYPHFDTEGLWDFFVDGLKLLHSEFGIDAISVTTHGACAALLASDGTLAAPVLDYEHTGPDLVREDYARLRPAFAETGSPHLAMGLNIGAQIYWQFRMDPELRDRVADLVTWPQYWGFRLTGVRATDVTSLGCHTDLWNPYLGQVSSLVDGLGLTGKIAPARRPGEVLGHLTAKVAGLTGLPEGTPVATGIHDSNASLLPHLIDRKAPFSVVSTGTWVVVMAVGGHAVTLDASRDTLINVNAFGEMVCSARFMGGREYEAIRQDHRRLAGAADAQRVLDLGLMLLPSVVAGTGPFPARRSGWFPTGGPGDDAAREVALGYYLALMTAECLAITGADGPVIVEGPFARNPFYLDMLAAATTRAIAPSASQTGTAIGAALLFAPEPRATVDNAPVPGADRARLQAYAAAWRSRASSAE